MSLRPFHAALLLGAAKISGSGRLYTQGGEAQDGSELQRYGNCGWGKLCLLLSLSCFLPFTSRF
jgi:hypothetical protein